MTTRFPNANAYPGDVRSSLSRKLLCCAVAQALFGLATVANAATITVNSAGDDGTGCTLRNALSNANNDIANNTCAGGSGHDIIVFDGLSLPATITLESGYLILSSALTIQGPGAELLTIDANQQSRIFRINDYVNDTVPLDISIEGLTLTGGSDDSGGGIINAERLTLNEIVLTGNTATGSGEGGGINMPGSFAFLELINSTVSNNTAANRGGGIIMNGAIITLQGSSIINNVALENGGGGIMNRNGTLVIVNSTIAGNTAQTYGGGISQFGSATTALTNSTISGNSAAKGGGGSFDQGTVALANVTIADNTAATGAGLYQQTGMNLSNTVIANNAGEDCTFRFEPFITAENLNSLIGDGSCEAGSIGLLTGDPLLGPLQDNGGSMLTHSILAGSPLIDAGDDTACAALATDQVGMPRSIDGDADGITACDIGALEFIDQTGPLASLISAPDVDSIGASVYELVIDYDDGTPIDTSSLGVDDILVDGSDVLVVESFSTADNGSGGQRVTYSITPPGGSWSADDKGKAFTINLKADQVFDTAAPNANSADAAVLGSFSVTLFPEIEISGKSVVIADGDTTPDIADDTDFGSVTVNSVLTRTFTISNSGKFTLNLTAPVTVSGPGFSVTQPVDIAVAPDASTTFDISFMPTGGPAMGTVTVMNDDEDEGEYTFTVAGNGNGAPVLEDTVFNVLESIETGDIIGQVQPTDPDGNIPATGAFEITAGNVSGAFAISDNGTLSVTDRGLISETQNPLTVKVTDSGGLSDTAQITINVWPELIFLGDFED